MINTEQLLIDFAKSGSEAAFRQIVERYVDLVYSVALRRVNGDSHAAQDITQIAFADLASKVRSGDPTFTRGRCALGGWLHRHTCFIAANQRRAEQRRQVRESIAAQMNELHSPSEPAWTELAPLVDEAINQLPDDDRHALVLRFYEKQDLRSVGATLGISDDAAQKRVSRALDKLRESLALRGVTIPGTALLALLADQAVSAAPAQLAAVVSQAALAQLASLPATGGWTGWLASTKAKLLVATATLALVITPLALLRHTTSTPSGAQNQRLTSTPSVAVQNTALATDSGSTAPAPEVIPFSASSDTNTLRLTVVAADSGKPIPGIAVDYWCWQGSHVDRKSLHADRAGRCLVPVPRASTTQLQLTTQVDDFADTRLQWNVERGAVIPEEYLVRVTRPTALGGRVVDAAGRAVEGAEVGFNHQDTGPTDGQTESHSFGWIAVKTDADGKWRINRIAEDMMARLYGGATHPEHVGTSLLFVHQDAGAEKKLRAGSHVFKLGKAVTASGTVVDAQGLPIPTAKVRVGPLGFSGTRESKVEPDGTFHLRGCRPGPVPVTAEAEGFAPTTVSADLADGAPPIRVVLQGGKSLRIRLVDKAGRPVPNANVWLNTHHREPAPGQAPDRVQAEFNPTTDANGCATWPSAPDQEMSFDFHKSGFMRVSEVRLRPDDQEHVIVLPPALVISGTVVDAKSGTKVTQFRIGCGWPSNVGGGQTQPRWSSIDRFWPSFTGGSFQHVLDEPVIMGIPNPGYVFKFEADGYAPFVTRTVLPDEGEVSFAVELQAAALTVVTVVLPDGRPAAGADVGLVAPGSQLTLLQGRLDRSGSSGGGALLTAGADGRVSLPSDNAITRVIAVHPLGYAEAPPTGLASDPFLRLQSWGRVEGVFFAQGKPATERQLTLDFVASEPSNLRFDSRAFRATTDAQGGFVLTQAPPGQFMLIEMVPAGAGGNAWAHRQLKEVRVKSGETTSVEVGKSSCALRLLWPEGFQPTPGWQTMAAITTPSPWPPKEIANDPEAAKRWMEQPEIKAALARARTFPLAAGADGTWTGSDIPAGTYSVKVLLMDPSSGPKAWDTGKRFEGQVQIAADASGPSIDLGEVALQLVP